MSSEANDPARDERLVFIKRVASRAAYNTTTTAWPKNIIYALASEVLALRKEIDDLTKPRQEQADGVTQALDFAKRDRQRLLSVEGMRERMGAASYAQALASTDDNIRTLSALDAHCRGVKP